MTLPHVSTTPRPHPESAADVLRWQDLHDQGAALRALLADWGLHLERVPAGQPIPGSYWGDDEAGLIGNGVWVRPDTPVHSILHEACHAICMGAERRAGLHTDAGGDDLEECAVCYLQILLADHLAQMGRERMLADMQSWGYSFRLGSPQAWFTHDAADARAWLDRAQLLDRAQNSRAKPCAPHSSTA